MAALRLLLIAALVVGWGHPPCPYECDDMGEDAPAMTTTTSAPPWHGGAPIRFTG